ncbi:uncharacterized protein BJ212DRAFT_1576823 [Suillus subaureus]|uniref:F-box domain-containing protein n=1 Tax=Suillus subaureus TaxID=48587 RepID=A0A9P7EBZ7_9AGAM|nr:uncharacterized protein BJ212DRAFT_1576823 [Suillus subaureus]KAG1817216.1 hypothetical protein BJ212DRAFT_1576823 [Suillus subaureus]
MYRNAVPFCLAFLLLACSIHRIRRLLGCTTVLVSSNISGHFNTFGSHHTTPIQAAFAPVPTVQITVNTYVCGYTKAAASCILRVARTEHRIQQHGTLKCFFQEVLRCPKSLPLEISVGVDSTWPCRLRSPAYLMGVHTAHWNRWSLSIDNQSEGCITPIKIAVFRPLCAFRNLRKLEFRAYDNYILRWDDAALLQMAKAWPLLEVLHLNKYDHSSRGVTPGAFLSLLQHCPRLVSVTVIVNWSTIDGRAVSLDAPYRGFAHKAISEVFFGSPRIRHPTRIAAFISVIMPSLGSIVTWHPEFGSRKHPDSEKYSTRWKCVQDLIKIFSAVREQGRRMVLNAGEGADGSEGPYNHYGIAQFVHEPKNGDAAIDGDNEEDGEVSEEDGGSEDESEYMSDKPSEEENEENGGSEDESEICLTNPQRRNNELRHGR